ncbi:tetratricopeptide repeat protein [Flavobacterium sp.]|uniref:tetratricopeptide repeat protein n=1 Tax=Flavobacterium sp. TaxID=239 RepID=UPI003527B472
MYIINKHTFIFLYILMLTNSIISQNTKIDSLKNELKFHPKKDTIRVNLLNSIAEHYLEKNHDKAISYLNESESISGSIDFLSGKAKCLLIKGKIKEKLANFDEALNFMQESLNLYRRLNLNNGVAQCYFDIGVLYYNQGNMASALENYAESLKIFQKLKNKSKICQIHNLFGNAYSNLGNYPDALTAYKKAIAMSAEMKDEERTSDYLNNIGSIYGEQGNYPLALENFNKSLLIKKKLKDTIGILSGYSNVGIIYKLMKDYDKAIVNYNEALTINERFNDKVQRARFLNNIGLAYQEKKDYSTALMHLKIAENISKETKNVIYQGISLNNIATNYLLQDNINIAYSFYNEAKELHQKSNYKYGLCFTHIGLTKVYIRKKKYEEALKNALKIKEISTELNLIKEQKTAFELLSTIYHKIGNYKKAFENHEQFKKLSDCLLNEENIKKIAAIEYEYKYKKELDEAADREVKLNKTVETTSKDLEKSQRKLLLGIISFLVTAMVLGSIIFFLKLRNSKAKTQNIITEQKLLRTQMTPHFIFNSLSVLQGMILNKEEAKSVTYLSKFSKLLRITLENSRDKTVLLSKELEAVENYLSLQHIEKEAIEFKLNIDNSIDVNIIKVPPMLIQPFVENAIEHAFKIQKENCVIEIKLTLVDSKLICVILDNGMGIDSSERNSNQNKKSLATKITKERLDYLSKDFKMEASITIEDRSKYDAQGTQVTIQIPYSKTEQ